MAQDNGRVHNARIIKTKTGRVYKTRGKPDAFVETNAAEIQHNVLSSKKGEVYHSKHESRYQHERHGNPKNPDEVGIFRTMGYSGPHFGLIHIGGLPPFSFKRSKRRGK